MDDKLQKLFLILLCIYWSKTVLGKFDFYTRGFKCKDFDPEYFENITCRLKAKRGHKGILFATYDVKKPIDVVWLHMRLFWQGSNTRFQPYLLDLDLDVCQAPVYVNTTNPLLLLIIQCTKKLKNTPFMENIRRGCPLVEPLKLVDYEPEYEVKPYLPPIAPEGTFKIEFHFHSNTSRTWMHYEAIVELRQRGISDFINLG